MKKIFIMRGNYREQQLVVELLDLKLIYETIPPGAERESLINRLFRHRQGRRQIVEELFAEIAETKFFA